MLLAHIDSILKTRKATLHAQSTWNWNPTICPSVDWHGYCSSGTCGTNQTRYLNNWGSEACGNPNNLNYPGPGSQVFLNWTNPFTVSLNRNVDILSLFANNQATFRWLGGTITLRNPNNQTPGVFTNEGLLRLEGSGERSLRGRLVNAGQMVMESGFTLNNATLENTGTLTLQSGTMSAGTGSNLLRNTGTIVKNTTGSATIQVPLEQQNATVNVQVGTLSLTGGGAHQQTTWSVAANATLSFASGVHTLYGTHQGAPAGALQLTGGTLAAGGTGATLNFTGAAAFQFSGGILSGESATLTNQGVLRCTGTGTRTLRGTLVNTGQLLHEGGTTNFADADLENAGTLILRLGTLANASGVNFLLNTGVLLKQSTNPNNPQSATVNTPARNLGLIDIRDATLTMANLTQAHEGETRVHRNATLSLTNPMQLLGGKLTGAGTVSGNVVVSGDSNNPDNPPGAIAPGIGDPNNTSLNPLGILTLNGNLTVAEDGVLEFELAGTNNSSIANPQYDQIRVAGTTTRAVQLNGTLRLKGRNNYIPPQGATFDVILRTASNWNRTGTFQTVDVDTETLPCVQVQVQYLTDRVRVVVTGTGTGSPDIDRNGCVDDSDLLAVLFAFGSTGANPADINCDSVVDDSDLLAVLFAFGQGC